MKQFRSWDEVGKLLKQRGVVNVYVKQLAAKQDNDKNQIYISKRGASPFAQVEHILPLTFRNRPPSKSKAKSRSRPGTPILEGLVPWTWLDRDGSVYLAPGTRAIFYLQFPEVRLSGFLKGCKNPPDPLRRAHQAKYGTRALVFGTGIDGVVCAFVVTSKTDPDLFPLAGLKRHPQNSLFFWFKTKTNALDALLSDLQQINVGWHKSARLTKLGEPPKPFRGTQAGGYTLESLLGIPSNANKEPDRDGIEVKSFSKNKVSLMTPVPDGGVQKEGLANFLKEFGYSDSKDPSCRKFNGVHKFGERHKKTGLTLTINGYDDRNGFSVPENEVVVALVDRSTGKVACSWSYPRLFESWNRKHSQAVYVSARKRVRPEDKDGPAEYRFAETVYVCEGTTSKHLLDAIISKAVVYDPGDTSKSGKSGKPKQRPQWRVVNLKSLERLYDSVKKTGYS